MANSMVGPVQDDGTVQVTVNGISFSVASQQDLQNLNAAFGGRILNGQGGMGNGGGGGRSSPARTANDAATAVSSFLQRDQIRQRQGQIVAALNDFDTNFLAWWNKAAQDADLGQALVDLRNMFWTSLQAMDDTYTALLVPMIGSGVLVADDLGLFSSWMGTGDGSGAMAGLLAAGGGLLLGAIVERRNCQPKLGNNGLLVLP